MNNQITLAYLDYDDLDALQVVSVVSFYEWQIVKFKLNI